MSLQDQIAAAEAALDKLMTGTAVVEVHDGDSVIRYQAAKPEALRAYIDDLKRQAGLGRGRTRSRRAFF
jgi:hypothetical protein